jgi:predicted ArsR family transcriptional regulator
MLEICASRGDNMPKAPHPESEYFGKLDVEKKRKIAEEKTELHKKESAQKLKDLHYGHCSFCGNKMRDVAFKGTTIFRCDNCLAASLNAESLEKLCGCEDNLIDMLLETFKFKIK